MTKKPRLSVIVASYNSEGTIEGCLESLQNQTTGEDLEVIVVDSSRDGTAGLVEERFPEVNLIRSRERRFAGGARNLGITQARGDIIAFIDADCTAQGNWADEILKAHRSAHLAIGGAFANGNPESYVGWAAYFCEFSQWMPDTPVRFLDDIAAGNMSYKKEVFEKYGSFIEGTYCSDTDLHWKLVRDGHRLLFVPAILVYHRNIENFGKFIRHEYEHGRYFARVRTRAKDFSGPRRFLYMSCFPLVAARLFLDRALANLKNRTCLSDYLKASPLLALGLISWSFGECVGYAKGPVGKAG